MEARPTPNVAGEVLAKLFEITPRRLQQLAKEGTLIREGRGQYPFLPNVRAYIRYLRAGAQPVEDIDPDRMEPFKRRAFYQGEQEKNRLREQAGELIPRLQYEEEIARVIKILAHALDTLPDVLERDANVPGPVLAIIEEICDRTRVDMHDALGLPLPDAAPDMAAGA